MQLRPGESAEVQAKVYRVRTILILVSCLLLVAALSPDAARASQVDMYKLPAYEPNRCATCHVNSEAQLLASPVLGQQVNAFGADWLELGRVWGDKIAAKDSDGDQCRNGAELDDYAGTAVEWNTNPTAHDGQQNSNPGSADCTPASINDRSWGILKAVFGDANKFKVR